MNVRPLVILAITLSLNIFAFTQGAKSAPNVQAKVNTQPKQEAKADQSIAPEILQEIMFWTPQMFQHALFLSLGMNPPGLKADGVKLFNQIKEFFENFKQSQDKKGQLPRLKALLGDLKSYKNKIKDRLNSGQWIGWIFPSFVQHTLDELEYFENKLNGKKYSKQEEIKFWSKERSDEAAITAHLLDPAEQDAIRDATNLSMKLKKIPQSEEKMWIGLTISGIKELDKAAEQLQDKMKNNKLKSIIHPLILQHIIREGKRGELVLNRLQAKA